MNPRLKVLRSAALMLCLGGAGLSQAQTATTPQIFANLRFSFSSVVKYAGNDYGLCSELRVDAIGDFVNSTKFAIYGALDCPAVLPSGLGFTAAGSGYFGSNGTVNMAFLLGSGVTLQCLALTNLAGGCDLINSTGFKVGQATIALK